MAPLLPRVAGRGRPWLDHRLVVEGIVWRYRTGAPWRDVPERFGPWNTVFKRFDRWAKVGTWARVLAAVQGRADQLGSLDWVCRSIRPLPGCISTVRPCRAGCVELH